jgi:hypothetical protein
MAGPYATVARVKSIGGLNEALDYNLYRFADVTELNTEITDAIAVAKATIRSLNSSVYDAPDADQLVKITRGEAYYALYFAYPALKARKVTGTHWPVDSEGSERYAELIDSEWLALAQTALEGIIDVSPAGTAFARPTLSVTNAINRTNNPELLTQAEIVQGIAEEARSLASTETVEVGA